MKDPKMADHSSLLLRVRRLMRGDAARRTADDSGPPDPGATPSTREPVEERRASEPPVEKPRAGELEWLEAEAKHHRARLALYRARMYALKSTSPARLRELERRSSGADERLAHARRRPA
jgi:hypothetical protein